jgi:putative Holliday junction resolvase
MRFLALDIGERRTGVAYLDDATGVPLPLDTLHHANEAEFRAQVSALVDARKIDSIVVGLPRLPDGSEGAQARFVRERAAGLPSLSLPLEFIDERYTTPQRKTGHKEGKMPGSDDPDAAAACEILRVARNI